MENKNSFSQTESHKHFGGHTNTYTHFSETCQSNMNFAAYIPPQAMEKNLPVVYWLSGLTCSEQIFITEASAQFYAKKHGLILVIPDTSPRDTGIPGENDSYDLGTGAGFYVDATESKWSKHFNMYSYVTQELRHLVEEKLPIDSSRRAISGHSMGGHGALVLGLRNPDIYQSISAFAPICAPTLAPWGIKAFSEYLGQNKSKWSQYDACELMKTTQSRTPILIDQGLEDEFLPNQLFTQDFEKVVASASYPATIRRQAGYDHSYFFISTFIDEHLAFHAANFSKL